MRSGAVWKPFTGPTGYVNLSTAMIETHLLIVGAGAAGAMAAIEAARCGADVLLCTKGIMGRTGITPLSSNVFQAVIHADDSPHSYFQDTVRGGRHLSDQNLVEVMAEGSSSAFQELMKFGVQFQTEGGVLHQRTMAGHSNPRAVFIVGRGQGLMVGLRKEAARHPNLTILEDFTVTRLLTRDGRISGAVALEMRGGDLRVIRAGAVLLATGGNEALWPFYDTGPDSTGDGYSLAYRAGAELIDMEMVLHYPTVLLHPSEVRGTMISYELYLNPALAGGRLTNIRGEDILGSGPMPTRDVLVRAILDEIEAGRAAPHGGLYIDLRSSSKSREEILHWIVRGHGYRHLTEMGLNPLEERLEVAPACHFTLGGIRINERGMSNVAGLFAAGECAANLHGANRLSGNALTEAVVFGAVAGREAASLAKDAPAPRIDREQVRREEERVMGLKGEGGLPPSLLTRRVRQVMGRYLGLRRGGTGLKRALAEIESLKMEILPRLRALGPRSYNPAWAEAIHSPGMLMNAEMVARSALLREESRGHHLREDFPETDDRRWLRHTLLKDGGSEISLTTAPIGVTKHPAGANG